MTDPANWTTEQAQAAQAELDELERTDPEVAAAAASYDRMVERINDRARANSTEAARSVADKFLASMDCMSDSDVLLNIVGMLATQRAEIHARYEAECRVLDDSRSIASDEGVRRGYNRGVSYAARRIRAVKDQ